MYEKNYLGLEVLPEMKDRKLIIVPRKDVTLPKKSKFVQAFAIMSIFSMIVPIIIIDISATLYQFIYFGILGIPKIKKSDYLLIDRHKLKHLSFFQKLNCVYCDYANGILPWATAVTKQTEIYSCAIKRGVIKKDQEHQVDFYERSEVS